MIDVVQAVMESKASKIKLWPINSNRASELGHPCERYLVYNRTRWQEKSLHDVGLQLIFDQGNRDEEGVLADLKEAGFKIVEQQRPFEWKKYQITGTIDAKILDDGKTIPVEIKSFSQWNWKAINSVDDMVKSKAVYMRKYPAQMTLYLIMDEKEEGLFILRNKSNGRLKQIPMSLDFEYAESLIKKAERINGHVANGTLPDRIEDDTIHEYCSFQHICLPDRINPALLIDDPEAEMKINRAMELKEQIKPLDDEYKELWDELKEAFKEKQAVIGPWQIVGKWIEKKGFEVKPSKYWDMRIKKI